jgi:hypothetical protein
VPRARRDPRRPQAPSPRRSRRRRRHPLHWATRDHRPLRGHLGGKLWWHVTKIDQISSGCGCMRNQEKHEKSNWCWSMNQNESKWINLNLYEGSWGSYKLRSTAIPTYTNHESKRLVSSYPVTLMCLYPGLCSDHHWRLAAIGWRLEQSWIYSIACQSCIAWKTVRRHWIACCCAIFAVCLLGLPFLFLAVLFSAWISWTHTWDMGRNAGSSLWPTSNF